MAFRTEEGLDPPLRQANGDEISRSEQFSNASPRRHIEHSPGIKSPHSVTSPQASREPSPSRQWLSPNSVVQFKDTVNRNVPPPTRTSSSTIDRQLPSTAPVIQRSSTSINPSVHRPTSLNDAVSKLWKLQRQQNGTGEVGPGQSPLASPGLKSPKTSRRNSLNSVKEQDGESPDTARIPNRGGVAESADHDPTGQASKVPAPQPQSNGGPKPSRGFSGLPPTLETVEEGDHSVSPTHDTMSSASSITDVKASREYAPSESSRDEATGLDGSDGSLAKMPSITPQRTSTDKKAEPRRDSSSQSNASAVRRPYTSLVPTKVRASNDGSARNMTVETETVSSIPQTSVVSNPGERGGTAKRDEHGTLRLRPSNETIKPKKEKKKTKKAPSIISGTNSSKADIFEAKVASAVDEDSSDSGETFVYESNPPEPKARQIRHHSRTPSVTSMQSLGGDRRAARAMGSFLDGPRKLRGKRSMKFASNPYNASSMDDESGDGGYGTVRASNFRTTASSDMQSKHRGFNGRGSDSPSEIESPFSHASRIRSAHGLEGRRSPKPLSPGLGSPSTPRPYTRKEELSPYDLEGERADDERAPLAGSIRSSRTRPSRRRNDTSGRYLNYYQEDQRGWMGRFAGAILVIIAITLIIMGASAFLFATSKPLFDVSVREVQNVLASEQEIMLDLLVEATNPNIMSIIITDMDVNIFAKSRHVRGDLPWLASGIEKPSPRKRWLSHLLDTELHGPVATAPFLTPGPFKSSGPVVDDPSKDPQTMLLGRIFHFDSVLLYEGSPFRRAAHNSTGELRLQRPGNKTDDGGTEIWERVLQHPFELIVRGILKYKLPLSTITMTVTVGASLTVYPEELLGS